MDVRKSAMTAPAGTLRMLKNAVINPGGEIEKRQAFVFFANAPANSVGLMRMGDFLWAVGAGGTTVAPTPTTVGYWPLQGLPGGVTPVELLDYTQFGTKLYTVTLGSDGIVYHHYDTIYVPSGKGTAVVTINKKIYSVDGQYVRACALNNPQDWAGTGAWVNDLSAADAEMLDCRGLEVYYDKLAVLSQRAAQIWTVKSDTNENQLVQTLRQAGAVAPKSIRQYGSGDILYLSQDGVRSLKAREQTITASVSDIGSPMDPYVLTLANTVGVTTMAKATALLEPTNGRYWFVTEDQIMVLSNYPNPKIAAWSVFEPGFDVTDAATAGPWIYLRDRTNKVWRYGGGLATPIYDSAEADVIMPFLSFDKPATFKQFTGVDAAVTGTWQLAAGFNPANEAAEDNLGTVTGPTFLEGQFAMMGHSTHCSLRFRTTASTRCVLSSVMIHYQETTTG